MEKQKNNRMITVEKAYETMARACARKEYAPFDIAVKLQRLELPERGVDKIIERLKKEKYLDEKRFVRSYIHDKLQFNRWGRKKITLMLRQKKLPQALIDEAFAELPDTMTEELLLPLLEKKWKSLKEGTDYEKRGKLIRYALGRGFSMDEVMDCMAKMQIEGIGDEME